MKNDFSIETFSQKLLTSCEKVQLKTFEKNEIITTYIVNRNQVCIVLEGCADLMRYDFNGNQTVVEKFNKFDVFGEIFYKINTNNELFVIAKEKSKINNKYSYETNDLIKKDNFKDEKYENQILSIIEVEDEKNS